MDGALSVDVRPRDPLATNERILRAISQLYAGAASDDTNPAGRLFSPRTALTPSTAASGGVDEGLHALCARLGAPVAWPRRKLVVMLVGNHSVGKSSFINWYLQEAVQATGVAIETHGFALVTSGRRRETLRGPATLRLFAHLGRLAELGALHALTTEISPSRARAFPLLTLVDTPGLVDGGFEYAFDVEACVHELAAHADLVLAFFDPSTQALCDRTLAVVARLGRECPHKLRCYLSKADSARTDADRNKVLVQIVQTLSTRAGLTLRELPCLYLPDASEAAPLCANALAELCLDFEKAIEQTVQAALDKAKSDCAALEAAALGRLARARAARTADVAARRRSRWLLAASALPPLLLALGCCARVHAVETRWYAPGPGRGGRRSGAPSWNRAASLTRARACAPHRARCGCRARRRPSDGSEPGGLEAGDGYARALDAACALVVVACLALHTSARWTRSKTAAAFGGERLGSAALRELEAAVVRVREELGPRVDALYCDYLAESLDPEFA